MDQPPRDIASGDAPIAGPGNPSRTDGSGDNTQYLLGQLSGTVGNLGKQVAGFDKRLSKKESVDQTRHETQLREQRQMGEKIFSKIDELKEQSHSTPCTALSTAEEDIDDTNERVGTVENCVRDIKTTGRVSWKAIVIACSVIAFILGISIPIILALWPKT